MKKVYFLTTAAGILLALASPSFAAARAHHAYDAYASGADRSGAYYYGPSGVRAQMNDPYGTQDRAGLQPQYNSGQNLPYPDRPYGAPDSW